MEKIKIENLTFAYPLAEKNALDDINLTIEAGEFITICGKSGCGKTTLLRNIKPILTPNGKKTGRLYIGEKEAEKLTHREQTEKIGFVMQNPDNQTVTDKVWHELVFGLESLSADENTIRGKAAEAAAFFGIQEWFYKDTAELSGGQKQILNLASVMMTNPSILLLDEPSSQLDPIAAHNFFELLSRINREIGVTVILSEHNLEEAMPISDRIILIDDGRITADSPPEKIGYELKKMKSGMFFALPVPSRVYYEAGDEGASPVTVREGREWLLNKKVNKNIIFEDKNTDDIDNKDIILSANNIWFRYEKNLPDILKGFSINIRKGEIYAVLGGNGTGKSTALSVISGVNRAYRGKIKINGSIALMPQNPQCLFVCKTVMLDIKEAAKDINADFEDINKVIDICQLQNLLDMHPYDLSGGEQQRAAMAKVLLRKADILMLDEPTKGLDCIFKKKLAEILCGLKNMGITIVIVSHDIEFCAEYADRCGMFFDGKIISEEKPHKFFGEKNFYTTAAGRISAGILKGAVYESEILSAVGAKPFIFPESHKKKKIEAIPKKEDNSIEKKQHIKIKNIIPALLSAAIFILMQFVFWGEYDGITDNIIQMTSIISAGTFFFSIIPNSGFNIRKYERKKLSAKTKTAVLLSLILVPVTIWSGMYFFGDRKYYFISMLVILESVIPFAVIFENRKPKARELVMISSLTAIAVAGRMAFFMLPQFKPISAVVIISGIAFGGETGFLVGALSGFISNFFFGQGPWTPWQMFALGLMGLLSGIIFKNGLIKSTKITFSVVGFFLTLIIYGGIINFASVVMYQSRPTAEMFISAYSMGIPFDLIHAVSTVFFMYFTAEPVLEKLDRIKIKYGLY